MSRFYGRKKFKVGPFYAWITLASLKRAWSTLRGGKGVVEAVDEAVTSWGVEGGPVTHNVTRDQTSVDLPGPINWRR